MTPERFTVQIEVAIRACEAADLAKLEWFGAFTHHRAIIREAFEMQARGEAVMLLADVGGFPVGQAWLDLREKPPMAWAVRVMEPFKGLGLGARLMAALEGVAAKRGHARLQLGVEKGNPGAKAFYQRLGWRIAGERQESYGYVLPDGQAASHALDEWVMVKDLTPAG